MPKSRTRKKKRTTPPSVNCKEEFLNYITRLNYFFHAIQKPEAMDLILPSEFKTFYGLRTRPLTVEFAKELSPNKELKNRVRCFAHYMFYEEKIQVYEGAPEISRYEYLALGRTLVGLFHPTVDTSAFSNFRALQRLLKDWIEMEGDNSFVRCEAVLKKFTVVLGLYLFRFETQLFQVSLEERNTEESRPNTLIRNILEIDFSHRYVIKLNAQKRKAYKANIAGHPRSLYRLELFNSEGNVVIVELSTDLLRYKHRKKGVKSYKVYIQQHAINRLSERLDCISRLNRDYQLLRSVREVKELIVLNKNSYLVPVFIKDIKVGYFVMRPWRVKQEEFLLIHTFLFLTSVEVPEGKKLEELLGISKGDNSFLKLDKLSSFVKGDMQESKELMSIFDLCGISPLFSFYENSEDKNSIKLADQIISYLGLNDDDYEIIDSDLERLHDAFNADSTEQ